MAESKVHRGMLANALWEVSIHLKLHAQVPKPLQQHTESTAKNNLEQQFKAQAKHRLQQQTEGVTLATA